MLTAFVEEVKKQSLLDDSVKVDKNVAIVYSPLNGTGLKPVLRTLKGDRLYQYHSSKGAGKS